MSDTAEQHRRIVELERADAARKALEEAAVALEGRAGNDLYQKAWRVAAALLRGMKIHIHPRED